ncbi:MAG: hypothetical protein ACRDXB_11015, partial [Actinomycetes bacterium]
GGRRICRRRGSRAASRQHLLLGHPSSCQGAVFDCEPGEYGAGWVADDGKLGVEGVPLARDAPVSVEPSTTVSLC